MTFFVVSFASADEDEARRTSASKQTTKCHIFFQEFLQGFVKFSKLCQWFHVAKCYSELKNEELSSKKLPQKLFGKSNFSGSLHIRSPQIPVFSGQIKITSLFEIIHMCYVMNQLFLPIFCPLYVLCLDLIWIIYFLSNSKDACISLHILAISLLKYYYLLI